jgi:hypothetical protein
MRPVSNGRRSALRTATRLVVLLLAGGLAAAEPTAPAGEEDWKLDAEEARLTLSRLAEKNRKLVQENLELKKRITIVSDSFASAQAELDLHRADRGGSALGSPLPVATRVPRNLNDGRVADANLDLALVALDVGREHGAKAGMQFSLVRDGVWIGRVRVLDVRAKVSGALVEETKPGESPKAGDRLMIWKESHGSQSS